MQVFVFLIETVFFLLVASSLLRAWLNGARISLSQQPGVFVMAVTNWIVMPLRRLLPVSVQRSRWDVASLLAAAVLCLIQAGLLLLMGGLLMPTPVGLASSAGVAWAMLPFMALKLLLTIAAQGIMWLVIGYAVLSWVQPHAPVHMLLSRLLAPLLLPIRRFVPLIGGVDLSALVLIVLLQVALMLI